MRVPNTIVKPVARRHGKAGHVRVACDVEPELRDALVELAWDRRTSLSDQIRQALVRHVREAGL